MNYIYKIAAVRILYYIDLLIHLPDPSTVNGIALGGIVAWTNLGGGGVILGIIGAFWGA